MAMFRNDDYDEDWDYNDDDHHNHILTDDNDRL